jgi:isochorismate hydrolase
VGTRCSPNLWRTEIDVLQPLGEQGLPPCENNSKEFKMATIREGKNAALVVVDVQVGVMNNAWDAARVIGNVAHTVERARAQGVPVIWVQHSDAELVHGSAEWEWVSALVPREDELRIHKQFNSSFEGTALDAELAKRGVSHIVLAGAATNWCTIEAESVVRELNVVMTWLDYPGRKCCTAIANEVSFASV